MRPATGMLLLLAGTAAGPGGGPPPHAPPPRGSGSTAIPAAPVPAAPNAPAPNAVAPTPSGPGAAARSSASGMQEPAPDGAAPLPDPAALMQSVVRQQRLSEAIQKDYIYRESDRFIDLDKQGQPKKTETEDYDVFWLQGVEVRKLVAKNGVALTPGEQAKESARIDKDVVSARQKVAKAQAEGKPTDSNGNLVVPISRILELGVVSNERRVLVAGRPTILLDYTGDPQARTRNAFETVVHDLAGTLAIDEQDRSIQHLEGRFLHDFKIGGGLLVDIKTDAHFQFTQENVNGEIWLPRTFTFVGQARVLLFFHVDGKFQLDAGDYRKFHATTTILPGYTTLPAPGESAPMPPPAGPPPQR